MATTTMAHGEKMIAVIGDINGDLDTAFTRLGKIQKKYGLDYAFFIGNVFADPDTITAQQTEEMEKLLRGELICPVPAAFVVGKRPVPEAVATKIASVGRASICGNFHQLTRKEASSTAASTGGLRYVSVGGNHSQSVADAEKDDFVPVYTDQCAESLHSFAGASADFLFTSDWPANVTYGSRQVYLGDEPAPTGVKSIADLCAYSQPRYHFSTSANSFEREPFRHNDSSSVTRFISLAPYGPDHAKPGNKSYYVFKYTPQMKIEAKDTTACPFKLKKRKADDTNAHHYARSDDYYDDAPEWAKTGYTGKRRREEKQSSCYFCLGSPNMQEHMIVSVGTHTYLTIAKGPLTRDMFDVLGFSCHMLIIPIAHIPIMDAIADEKARDQTRAEMKLYKESLQTMVSSKSTDAEGHAHLGAVTFEINRARGVHLHWQFLPVAGSMVDDGLVQEAFVKEAKKQGYPEFVYDEDIAEVEEGDYFKVMIWSEKTAMEMVMPVKPGLYLDWQFGRRALCKLLKLEPNKVHWQDCKQTEEEEKVDVEAFRKAFEKYDGAMLEQE